MTRQVQFPCSTKSVGMHLIALSGEEEEVVYRKMRSAALKNCDEILQEFAKCTRTKTFSVMYACNGQTIKLNKCLSSFSSEKVRDGFRGEVKEAKAKRYAELNFI
ncbi:hypothetical protein DFJ73DRAFT_250053 [Zopfochytrium polystomum]|nr:hypothetical protein DFJ73DRAFT_250053 [Zopfochytrium polystomum]